MIYRIDRALLLAVISANGLLSLALPIQSAMADEAAQYQLKAPINASPPAVRESNPGSDNYRRTGMFPTSVEKNLIDTEEAPKPHVIDRLTGMVGTSAQMKIHAGHDVTVGHLHGIQVEVQNDTDRPLLFDGDLATASVGGKKLTAATLGNVDNAASPRRSKLNRFLRDTEKCTEAAATLGAIPSVRDAMVQAGPIPQRYGADEARRFNELSRFGKRVLWPGDTTSGIIYFDTVDAMKGSTIDLPVSSTIDVTDHGSLSSVR